MSYMIWNHCYDHKQNRYKRHSPVKEPRRWFEYTGDFKDDELEKREAEREGEREDKLDTYVFDLIVLKELLHEENKSTAEKQNLKTKKYENKFEKFMFCYLTCETNTISVSSKKAISQSQRVYFKGKSFSLVHFRKLKNFYFSRYFCWWILESLAPLVRRSLLTPWTITITKCKDERIWANRCRVRWHQL